MSASVAEAVDGCRPAEGTPVSIDAETIESTARPYLRELKAELAAEGLVPACVTAEACFDRDCSLSTQQEADRLRSVVRAAAFLGAGTVTVSVDEVADPGKVRPALSACAERARREGVDLEVEGPVSVA